MARVRSRSGFGVFLLTLVIIAVLALGYMLFLDAPNGRAYNKYLEKKYGEKVYINESTQYVLAGIGSIVLPENAYRITFVSKDKVEALKELEVIIIYFKTSNNAKSYLDSNKPQEGQVIKRRANVVFIGKESVVKELRWKVWLFDSIL